MLRLDNIQAKVDRPIFKPRIRKFLRISAGTAVNNVRKHGKIYKFYGNNK